MGDVNCEYSHGARLAEHELFWCVWKAHEIPTVVQGEVARAVVLF